MTTGRGEPSRALPSCPLLPMHGETGDDIDETLLSDELRGLGAYKPGPVAHVHDRRSVLLPMAYE